MPSWVSSWILWPRELWISWLGWIFKSWIFRIIVIWVTWPGIVWILRPFKFRISWVLRLLRWIVNLIWFFRLSPWLWRDHKSWWHLRIEFRLIWHLGNIMWVSWRIPLLWRLLWRTLFWRLRLQEYHIRRGFNHNRWILLGWILRTILRETRVDSIWPNWKSEIWLIFIIKVRIVLERIPIWVKESRVIEQRWNQWEITGSRNFSQNSDSW